MHDARGETTTHEYAALLVASGYDWSPRLPDISGEFSGDLLYSQTHQDPGSPVDVMGKSVTVVGIGNTGCEVACKIAAAGADKVFISARGGT